MKTKLLIPFLALGCALMFLVAGLTTGCKGKLEVGGAYNPVTVTTNVDGTLTTNAAPDKAFFLVDSAFDLAYFTVDAAFKFEEDNRAELFRLSPNIKHTLDRIRPEALSVRNSYIAARKVYKANPSPSNLSALDFSLKRMQTVATSATAVLPK